jgi:ribosomal protein L44E
MADGVRSSPDPATARGASPAPGGGTRSSDRGHGRRRGGLRLACAECGRSSARARGVRDGGLEVGGWE